MVLPLSPVHSYHEGQAHRHCPTRLPFRAIVTPFCWRALNVIKNVFIHIILLPFLRSPMPRQTPFKLEESGLYVHFIDESAESVFSTQVLECSLYPMIEWNDGPPRFSSILNILLHVTISKFSFNSLWEMKVIFPFSWEVKASGCSRDARLDSLAKLRPGPSCPFLWRGTSEIRWTKICPESWKSVT